MKPDEETVIRQVTNMIRLKNFTANEKKVSLSTIGLDYQEVKQRLAEKHHEYLQKTNDPRVLGEEMKWIGGEYFAEKDKNPTPSKALQKELDLKEEYSYVK
jgi:hypothetical protein